MDLEQVVRAALREGAEEAEVYAEETRSISVKVEKGKVKAASMKEYVGLSVRALTGKKLGFAFMTNPSDPLKVAKEAVANARTTREDPDLHGLPQPAHVRRLDSLMDPKLRDIDVDEAAELFVTSIEAAGSFPKVVSVSGELGISYSKVSVLNSNGIDLEEERTSLGTLVETASQDGDARGSGWGFAQTRRLDEYSPEEVGRESGELAMRTLRYTKIGVEELPVIMRPTALFILIPFIVSGAANAENLQYARSFLTGKLGEKIGRDEISIVDDATLPWRVRSRSFDDEGVAAGVTKVVENGVFTTPVHNWYTAKKEGRETSTGNASREYNRPPSIDAHNVRIEAPALEMKYDELLDVKRGVMVWFTFDHPNLANGEFSGMAETAFLIEDGEVKESLRQTTLAFTIEDMLRGIDAVGDDVRPVMGYVGGSIRFKAKVAGPGS